MKIWKSGSNPTLNYITISSQIYCKMAQPTHIWLYMVWNRTSITLHHTFIRPSIHQPNHQAASLFSKHNRSFSSDSSKPPTPQSYSPSTLQFRATQTILWGHNCISVNFQQLKFSAWQLTVSTVSGIKNQPSDQKLTEFSTTYLTSSQ